MYELKKYNTNVKNRHSLIFRNEDLVDGHGYYLIKYIDLFGNIKNSDINIRMDDCDDIDLTIGFTHENEFNAMGPEIEQDWFHSWNYNFLCLVQRLHLYQFPIIVSDYIGYFEIYALLNELDKNRISNLMKIETEHGYGKFKFQKIKKSKRINTPLYKCTLTINNLMSANHLYSAIEPIIDNYIHSAISEKTQLNAIDTCIHNEIVCCPFCYHKYGTIQIEHTNKYFLYNTVQTKQKHCVRCGKIFKSPNRYCLTGTNQLVTIDEKMYSIAKNMFEEYRIHSIACCESHPPFVSYMYLYAYADSQNDFDRIKYIFKDSEYFYITVWKSDPKNSKEENDCYKNDPDEMVRFSIHLKPAFQKRNVTEYTKAVYLNEWVSLLNQSSNLRSCTE